MSSEFPDNFIRIPYTSENLDLYTVRTAILRSLNSAMPLFNGKLLDIGCGKMPYKEHILINTEVIEYVGLDIETSLTYDEVVVPDFRWDGVTMPFQDNEFDCAFGTEVLEHCPRPEVVIGEVFRVLKPGSPFFFTVPFLWNLHEVPHDEYRYTPFSLRRIFEQAGFTSVTIKATGGWHASLAQMLGLWIRRAPMGNFTRSFSTALVKPLIKLLLRKGEKEFIEFKEGQMITGLYGVAKK